MQRVVRHLLAQRLSKTMDVSLRALPDRRPTPGRCGSKPRALPSPQTVSPRAAENLGVHPALALGPFQRPQPPQSSRSIPHGQLPGDRSPALRLGSALRLVSPHKRRKKPITLPNNSPIAPSTTPTHHPPSPSTNPQPGGHPHPLSSGSFLNWKRLRAGDAAGDRGSRATAGEGAADGRLRNIRGKETTARAAGIRRGHHPFSEGTFRGLSRSTV